MLYDSQCNAEFNCMGYMKDGGKYSEKDATDCVLLYLT